MTDRRDYPARPIVGIGMAVLRPGQVLLVQRGKAPNIGTWSLPGGAQELGETAEAAARRELLEETGLHVGPLRLAANVDSIHRDDAGRVQYHYTIIDFAARWTGGMAAAGSDVSAVAWVSLDRVETFQLWSEAYRVIAIARALLGC
jgi:ADP-ribose pyrophosphatase YjhB (NUDIX family)